MEMSAEDVRRRAFLKSAASGVLGSAGVMAGLSGLSGMAFAQPGDPNVGYEVVEQEEVAAPKYSIKFSVCGMSHDHIYGMVGAMQRGGGVLVSAYGAEPEKVAAFTKRFPEVRMVRSEDEILGDPSIQLVLTSARNVDRAPLGVRVI